MIRLGEIPNVKTVEELFRKGSSRALRLVARAFMLAVTSVAWLLVLIATAAVLLVHLAVAAMARGTFATVSGALNAEAGAHDDMAAALDKLRGRDLRPHLATTESAKPPIARAS